MDLVHRGRPAQTPSVSAGGVLHVQRLITDPGSSLYAPPSFAAAVETPERTIRAVRDALEVC